MAPLATMSWMISTLNFSPLLSNSETASAAATSVRTKGASAATISFAFFSMRSSSSGENGAGLPLLAVEVVVEALFDHRADGDLRAGEQALHGVGDDVRGVVARHQERLGVLRGEDLQLGVRVDGAREIDVGAVQLGEDGGLGEAGADGLLDEVDDGNTLGRVLLVAVGQRNRDRGTHDGSLLAVESMG